MKKICAMILAVLMTAAVMTSCGSSDSSSQKDTSAAAVSQDETSSAAEASAAEESKAEEVSVADSETESAAESTAEPETESKAEESQAETESKAENNGEMGEFAKAYTEKIKGKCFSMDMTAKTMIADEMPVVIKVNGKDGYLKTNAMGIEMEVYVVDGKTYSIMPNMNAYYIMENTSIEDQSFSTYELPNNAVFNGTTEEDGLIVESYTIPVAGSDGSDDSLSTNIKYYFDSDGTPKKIVSEAPIMGESDITINSVSFDDVKIELPDLSGMTEMKQGELTDTASSVKMTLAIFGITEDMVTKAGYTIDQLAQLAENDQDAFSAAVKDIAEKNGIDSSLLNLGSGLLDDGNEAEE